MDTASAKHLNAAVHQVFAERQVYRIDHYLGKETVQNLLVLRFANAIFEPVWNRNYVSHVEITAAESLAIGHRAGYYERAGVLRDMFQNHLLQQLTLCAMEAPARFEADSIRDEKVKVLRAMRPMRAEDVARATVRGQYRGYRERAGRRPRQPDGHVRGGAALGRQLAVAGRAVLSSQRKGDVLPFDANHHPIPPAAAAVV